MNNTNTLRALKTARLKLHTDQIAADEASVARDGSKWPAQRQAKAAQQIADAKGRAFGGHCFKIYANRADEFGLDVSSMAKVPGKFEDAGTLDGHKVNVYWPMPGDAGAHIHFGLV